MYLLVCLSKSEQEKIKADPEGYFAFTSFARGYSDEKIAKLAKQRNLDSFLMTVELGTALLDEETDFGYWIKPYDEDNASEQNVYFNIYNIFEIKKINFEER